MKEQTAQLIAALVDKGFAVGIQPSSVILIGGMKQSEITVTISRDDFQARGESLDIDAAFTMAAEAVRRFTEVWDRGFAHDH